MGQGTTSTMSCTRRWTKTACSQSSRCSRTPSRSRRQARTTTMSASATRTNAGPATATMAGITSGRFPQKSKIISAPRQETDSGTSIAPLETVNITAMKTAIARVISDSHACIRNLSQRTRSQVSPPWEFRGSRSCTIRMTRGGCFWKIEPATFGVLWSRSKLVRGYTDSALEF